MSVTKSLSVLALVGGFVGLQSCVTDNPAAYEGILGPEREPAEEPSSGGGTGGTVSPTGGSGPSTGGTTGDGGMGDGGQPTAGSGGSAGTMVNPPPHPDFMPPCYLTKTTAGEDILKGVSCTPDDLQLCYRPCGPAQVGWKSETCMAGVYAEGDCRFPLDGDYSCYRLPDDVPQDPPIIDCGLTVTPSALDECTVDECTPCNKEGYYEDTGGDAKPGFCVCRAPDPVTGIRRWTCATDTSWPCPNNQGCF
jgi:hypothetical protein